MSCVPHEGRVGGNSKVLSGYNGKGLAGNLPEETFANVVASVVARGRGHRSAVALASAHTIPRSRAGSASSEGEEVEPGRVVQFRRDQIPDSTRELLGVNQASAMVSARTCTETYSF